jgi:phosphatidylglycerol:prolipoprotein diacylglycerol transferase
MSLLGIAAVVIYILLRRRNLGLKTDDLIHILLMGIIGAIIGSKALYLVTMLPVIVKNFELISSSPELLKSLLTQGSVFYGGLFGALLAIRLYCRRYSVSFKAVSMLIAGGVPLFHFFGRLGCFSAGCCYGIEASWGFEFTGSLSAPNGVTLIPVQLFESAANLLIFIFIMLFQRRSKHPERSLTIYLTSYAVCRIVLEFFRGDLIRGGMFGVSTSQWISAGILLYFLARIILRKTTRHDTPGNDGNSGTNCDVDANRQI